MHTIQELFDLLNGMQNTAMQQAQQMPQDGPGLGPNVGPNLGPNVGPNLGPGDQEWVGGRPAPDSGDQEWVGGRPAPDSGDQEWVGGRPARGSRNRNWAGGRPAPISYSDPDPVQDIANTVLEITTGFIGRAIGRRVQRTFEKRVGPAMKAREQMMQNSMQDQGAIVQRHPDLRGCMHDQVIFLLGGSRTVPVSDIRFPVTLAQADTLVDRLRAP